MSKSAEKRTMREGNLAAPWGGQLHYLEWPGEGTPIVLLHGLAGNALWWVPLAEALADRHILAIDMPGHGATAALDDWDMEKTAASVRASISEILGAPAVWGGQSWGGKVAALVAARHPAEVEALLLMESAPVQGLPIPPETFVKMRYAGELGSWPSLSEAITSARAMPQYAEWSDVLKGALTHGLEAKPDGTWSSRLTTEQAIEIARNAVGTDHSEAVSSVKCPAVLVISEGSLGWQEQTNIKAFPGAEKVVIPGGHWIHIDNVDGCAGAIRDFLSRRAS